MDHSDNILSASNQQRSSSQTIVVAIVIASLLTALGYWLLQRANHIYSSDARIAADMIEISSNVSGRLMQLPVSAGSHVDVGDTLAIIDSRSTALKLRELHARISAMRANYRGQQAEILMVERQTRGAEQAVRSQLRVSEAALSSSHSELEYRDSEWRRSIKLRDKKIISQQQHDAAKSHFHKAQQAKQAAIGNVASATAKLTEAQAAQDRLIVLESQLSRLSFQRKQLELEHERQQIDMLDRMLASPAAGVIDTLFVDRGEYLQPGRRLMLMHDPEKIWVNANIKETEVRHLRPGQIVAIEVDAYPELALTGRVEKIGQAATSEFALLPSTNPSGNFTKVTQRIKVKITIDNNEQRLKPGMMVQVAIDVRD